jgi:phage/plasmid-associated DNA primase
MREDFWQFDPTHTVFLATNHRPEVKGTDHAIWRRLKLIPFAVTIPEAEQDKELPEKLRGELPGVLAWIVGGCLEWRRDSLGEPDEVRAATTSYRADMNILAGFIEDRCVIDTDAWVKFSDLYASYQAWCEEAGKKAETKRRFGTRLKERGFEPNRGTDNVSIRRGIGLRDDHYPDPDGPTVIREPENYRTVIDGNRDKYAGFEQSNYPNYPENDMTRRNSSHDLSYEKDGNYRNYGNSSEGSVPLSEGSGRRLTAEQAERVKVLVTQGMSPKYARAEVLSEDA